MNESAVSLAATTSGWFAEAAGRVLPQVLEVRSAVAALLVRRYCLTAILTAEVDPDSGAVIAKAKRLVDVDGLTVE